MDNYLNTLDENIAALKVLLRGLEDLREMHATKDSEGWYEWRGGPCPVDGTANVLTRFRNGREAAGLAGHLRWGHLEMSGDVIAYRVLK